MSPSERLCRLLAERSFRTGDFLLSSGTQTAFYVDCRATTMHAEGQVLIGRVGFEALRAAGLAPDAVGGLTMGADPLAHAIAAESWRQGAPMHAFSVRKRPKRHGRSRIIEGCFEPGARVVIVEDVITTGRSALQACQAVRRERGEVLGVLALVDREEGGRGFIERAGLRVVVLYTAEQLRRHADPATSGSAAERS
ncbi:MAG: orotate phosphoribosyltransferase [Gemmatimonadota bacterium]